MRIIYFCAQACHMTFLCLNIIYFPIVIGVKESLFAALSQLELLWHNEIYVVKNMENILEKPLAKYRPLERYN